MKYRLYEVPRTVSRHGLLSLALCGALMAVSGCANMQEGVGPPTTSPPISGSAPQDTGSYPNLNIRPGVSGPQITADEEKSVREGLTDSVKAARANVAASTITPADQKRLNELANDQGK